MPTRSSQARQIRPSVWRIAAWSAVAILFGLAVHEVYLLGRGTGVWWFHFSPSWASAFCLSAAAALIGLGLLWLGLWMPDRLKQPLQRLTDLREKLGWVRWPLILILLIVPAWVYHYANRDAHWSVLLNTFYLLHLFFLLASVLIGALLTRDGRHLLAPLPLAHGLALFGFFLFSAGNFTSVRNYPFSLGWSEGNRLYDYSLVFGQNLYNHAGPIQNPYSSPLRYALWGALFLWQGLPIAAHRLWDALLYTLPQEERSP
jgi:hypothetical protein